MNWREKIFRSREKTPEKTIEDVQKFLKDTPGPSPWFLINNGPTFQGIQVEWIAAEKYKGKKSDKYSGKTFLLVDDIPKMIFDFQCYVKKITENLFLVWYEQTDNKSLDFLQIKIFLFDINSLKEIKEPSKVVQQMNENNKLLYEGSPISSLSISTSIDFGKHRIEVPEEFINLEEILILGKSRLQGLETNYFDKMAVSIYSVNFSQKQVEVIPQDWFNSGEFDFMYQWITRVKRDKSNNQIYGDGIRINPFKLNGRGNKIEKLYY